MMKLSNDKTMNRRTVIKAGAAAMATTVSTAPWVASIAADNPGAWTPLADMPFPVQEIYPTAFRKGTEIGPSGKPQIANILVNAGGLTTDNDFNVTDAVTFYDPAYDAWGYGTPLPEPRHHIALVSNNGILYAISGFARDDRGGWQMSSDCWRTYGVNGDWERTASLPHPQSEMVCVSLGGFIHAAGGRAPAGSSNRNWSDHIDTDEHWYYDPAADRWSSLAPMITPRNSATGVAINGVIYVIGGRTVSDGNTAAVEVYDPLSDRWAVARPMPKAQGGLASAVLNGKIYVFGGEYFDNGSGVYAEAWEYNPDTDQWRAVAAMPRRRHGLGAVSIGDAIYVLGGAAKAGGNETSAALDRFEI